MDHNSSLAKSSADAASGDGRRVSNGVRPLEAVIFDADGTILDTRELMYEAVKHTLTSHGYEMPRWEEIVDFGGRPANETYAHFAPHHDSQLLSDKHRDFQLEHLDLLSAYEGIDDLIEPLKKLGLKIGICTNRRKNVIDLINHLDIHHHFDGVVHADLINNYKPHPEGLFMICKKLGVEPSRSVMVGDTEADIGAGKAAGCAFTVGITHGIRTRDVLTEAGTDYIVDHLNDILPLVTNKF